ncbi:Uncharacterised protein [Mycobacteroides abscessus subsp. abscessus]|nr:Uncharacterised protein [Mycobacteroides abscessus subsp. abscessus]
MRQQQVSLIGRQLRTRQHRTHGGVSAAAQEDGSLRSDQRQPFCHGLLRWPGAIEIQRPCVACQKVQQALKFCFGSEPRLRRPDRNSQPKFAL